MFLIIWVVRKLVRFQNLTFEEKKWNSYVFEPILPSLVSRLTTAETKGTATGVYHLFLFGGHFMGALLAGLFYEQHFEWLVGVLLVLEMLFFYVTLNFQNPGKTNPDSTEVIGRLNLLAAFFIISSN